MHGPINIDPTVPPIPLSVARKTTERVSTPKLLDVTSQII